MAFFLTRQNAQLAWLFPTGGGLDGRAPANFGDQQMTFHLPMIHNLSFVPPGEARQETLRVFEQE